MIKSKLKLSLSLLVVLFVSGCSTMADSISSRGNGTIKVYDRAYDEVWEKAIEVVKDSNLDLVIDDQAKGMILAQRPISAFSYGENVAIFLDAVDTQDKTKVEVVNKLALSTTIFATNWESKIFKQLDEKLN
jgi:hypothetical protein